MTDARADRLQTSVDTMTDQLTGLRTDLDAVADRLQRQTRVSWTAIIVGVVLAGLLIYAVTDNRAAIASNNKLLCPVLSIVGSNNPPRTTEAGRVFVNRIYELGHRPAYGCW